MVGEFLHCGLQLGFSGLEGIVRGVAGSFVFFNLRTRSHAPLKNPVIRRVPVSSREIFACFALRAGAPEAHCAVWGALCLPGVDEHHFFMGVQRVVFPVPRVRLPTTRTCFVPAHQRHRGCVKQRAKKTLGGLNVSWGIGRVGQTKGGERGAFRAAVKKHPRAHHGCFLAPLLNAAISRRNGARIRALRAAARLAVGRTTHKDACTPVRNN